MNIVWFHHDFFLTYYLGCGWCWLKSSATDLAQTSSHQLKDNTASSAGLAVLYKLNIKMCQNARLSYSNKLQQASWLVSHWHITKAKTDCFMLLKDHDILNCCVNGWFEVCLLKKTQYGGPCSANTLPCTSIPTRKLRHVCPSAFSSATHEY